MTLDDKGDTGIFVWLKDAKDEEVIFGGYGGRDTDTKGEQWIVVSAPEIRKNIHDNNPYVFGYESKWLFRMSDIKSILVQNNRWAE